MTWNNTSSRAVSQHTWYLSQARQISHVGKLQISKISPHLSCVWWCLYHLYPVWFFALSIKSMILLQFTLFSRKICFVAIYAVLRGEKMCLWRKITNVRYVSQVIVHDGFWRRVSEAVCSRQSCPQSVSDKQPLWHSTKLNCDKLMTDRWKLHKRLPQCTI